MFSATRNFDYTCKTLGVFIFKSQLCDCVFCCLFFFLSSSFVWFGKVRFATGGKLDSKGLCPNIVIDFLPYPLIVAHKTLPNFRHTEHKRNITFLFTSQLNKDQQCFFGAGRNEYNKYCTIRHSVSLCLCASACVCESWKRMQQRKGSRKTELNRVLV